MKKIFIGVLFVVLLFSCQLANDDPDSDDETYIREPIYYDVKYEVTGTTPEVSITIENEDGGTSQFSSVGIPWIYEFTRINDSFVYLSAQNQRSTGIVIVTIYRNSDIFKTSTSEGAYVIATAYGTL